MNHKVKIEIEPKTMAKEDSPRPTLSMSRVIEVLPNGISFGGWGPKVAGLTDVIRNLN
jgi:hypothetical protein